MTKFNEMNPKELRQARNDMAEYLYPYMGVTRVSDLSDEGAILEGGKFPALYDAVKGELTIWSRSRRSTGARMTIEELVETENAVERFFAIYQQRGDEES